MKKFEDREFKVLNSANATYNALDLTAKLMGNQNEIIDWIEKSHPKSYKEWAEEQINGK